MIQEDPTAPAVFKRTGIDATAEVLKNSPCDRVGANYRLILL